LEARSPRSPPPTWAWSPRRPRSNAPASQPQQVEETIFGNARQAGGGPNPARQISIRSGVPQEVPAYTVNKACASGIKSIALGFQEIATGNLDCVLAGGTESMSRLPYYLEGARWGYRLGNQELVDGMYRDGFFCPWPRC
jgi:acetyl-CoA C-acetyltransferase